MIVLLLLLWHACLRRIEGSMAAAAHSIMKSLGEFAPCGGRDISFLLLLLGLPKSGYKAVCVTGKWYTEARSLRRDGAIYWVKGYVHILL